jgi:hypothetical protein
MLKKFSQWISGKDDMDPMGDNSNMPPQLVAMWPKGTEVAIKSKFGMMTGVVQSVDPLTKMAVVLDDNQRAIEVPVAMLRRRV